MAYIKLQYNTLYQYFTYRTLQGLHLMLQFTTNNDSLIIQRKKVIEIIKLEDIQFIEKFGNICIINTLNHTFEVRFQLHALMILLPLFFIRAHRSYIVNIKSISKLEYQSNDNIYKVFFEKSDDCIPSYAIVNREKVNEIIQILEKS